MKLAVFLLSFCCYSLAKNCDERYAIAYYKKPIYEFTTGLLDRVSQETDGHFVCSPIMPWLQLVNLAAGAHGPTLKQIWRVTGHGQPCMQRTLRQTLNNIYGEAKGNYKCQSLVMVDKYLAVNKNFKRKVEQSNIVKVAALNIDTPYDSADKANEIIAEATGIQNSIDPYEFNLSSLFLADVAKFKATWKLPFDPVFTTREPFYHGDGKVGEVRMMSQIAYFNYTKLKHIHAEVVELPCADEKRSMLIFLPTKGTIKDLFFHLKQIRIATLFNLFKRSKNQLMYLRLPRFKIYSEIVNLPELINDMGVSYIFSPSKGNLKGISAFPIQVNRMKSVAEIEVTEEGVSAEIAQPLINPEVLPVKFEVNRPFAFMLVDKPTEIVLFAGVYSVPSVS